MLIARVASTGNIIYCIMPHRERPQCSFTGPIFLLTCGLCLDNLPSTPNFQHQHPIVISASPLSPNANALPVSALCHPISSPTLNAYPNRSLLPSFVEEESYLYSASSVAHCKLTTAAMRAHLDVVGKVKEAVGEGGSVEPITDDEIFVFPVSLFDSELRTTNRWRKSIFPISRWVFFFWPFTFYFFKFQPLGWIQIHVDQMCGYRDSIVKSAVSEKLEGDE